MTSLELCCMSLRRANVLQLAEAAGHTGFDYITITAPMFTQMNPTGPELRRRIEDHGVKVSFIDGLSSALPGAGELARAAGLPNYANLTADDFFRIAHALGAPVVGLVHIGGSAQPLEKMAEAWGALCRRAAREGLRLTIEFYPESGIPDFKTAFDMVRTAGERNGGVLLDTWHFARGGSKLAELTEEGARWVGAIQLSDRTPDQDQKPYVPMKGRKLPGQGALPLQEMLARVLKARPELPVGAEVLSDDMEAMSFDDAARALATATRSILQKIGRA